MKIYNSSKKAHESMKVSKLLYALQTDIERVSNDRLQRFHKKDFEELQPTKMNPNLVWERRNVITLGDFVIIKIETSLFFGRLIKFKYSNSQTYSFNSYFFEINKNVDFFLFPSYKISRQNTFQEIKSTKWYSKSQYSGTLNENHIDFGSKSLPPINELLEQSAEAL
jgi:hypothetical protein